MSFLTVKTASHTKFIIRLGSLLYEVTEATNFSQQATKLLGKKAMQKNAEEHKQLHSFLDDKILRNVHKVIMGKY